jgi:phage tail sheath protein FI
MSAFTYPGVYIEELSSGVHTITGVATSIAAFVGWAPMGPVDEATMVESWAQYQSLFGGLDSRSLLGYAVNQFFANGGQQAYIVRVVWQRGLTAAPSTFPLPVSTAVTADCDRRMEQRRHHRGDVCRARRNRGSRLPNCRNQRHQRIDHR